MQKAEAFLTLTVGALGHSAGHEDDGSKSGGLVGNHGEDFVRCDGDLACVTDGLRWGCGVVGGTVKPENGANLYLSGR